MWVNEGGAVALVKTVGVVLLIGLALWIIFGIIGFLAFAIWTLLKILLIALIIAAVYHYFTHQNKKTT
jgi:hypothetical protein